MYSGRRIAWRMAGMRKSIVLIVSLLLLVSTGCQKDVRAPKEGDAAPDFNLTSLSGGEVRLSDLRGKVVLVNFWASWCPPCRGEIPSLVTLNSAMAGKNFRLLAVSVDNEGKDAIEPFFNKLGISLPTLFDPHGSVGKSYGITGVPETFIVDKNGIIRKKVVGPIDWSAPDVISFINGLASA
jgi:peroxiredoxin